MNIVLPGPLSRTSSNLREVRQYGSGPGAPCSHAALPCAHTESLRQRALCAGQSRQQGQQHWLLLSRTQCRRGGTGVEVSSKLAADEAGGVGRSEQLKNRRLSWELTPECAPVEENQLSHQPTGVGPTLCVLARIVSWAWFFIVPSQSSIIWISLSDKSTDLWWNLHEAPLLENEIHLHNWSSPAALLSCFANRRIGKASERTRGQDHQEHIHLS